MENFFTGLQQITFGNIKIMLIMLTPELAKALLQDEKRIRNRNIKSRTVEYLASQIPDLWVINGATIVVDSEGHLIDGQHRCAAVIRANTSIPVILISGIEPEKSFPTIDTNTARSLADTLRADGKEKPGALATAARILIAMDTNDFTKAGSNNRIPNQIGKDYVNQNPDLIEHVIFCKRLSLANRGIANLAVVTAFSWHTRMWDAHSAYFIEHLYTGAELRDGNPILLLRKKLIELNARRLSKRIQALHPYLLYASLVYIWNLWGAGRSLTVLRWPEVVAKINAPKIQLPGTDPQQLPLP